MFKDLNYPSLSALVADFRDSYAACHHKLLKLTLGLPAAHDKDLARWTDPVLWNYLTVGVSSRTAEELDGVLGKFTAALPKLSKQWKGTGEVPPLVATLGLTPEQKGFISSDYVQDKVKTEKSAPTEHRRNGKKKVAAQADDDSDG